MIAHTAATFPNWAYEQLSDLPHIAIHPYCTDCPTSHSSGYEPSQSETSDPALHYGGINKAHETHPYLTHLVNAYESLAAVTVFIHAHEVTWHNNDLLASSTPLSIRRLRRTYVEERGYVNLRCHSDPGCPGHLHPLEDAALAGEQKGRDVPQARFMASVWPKLFPGTESPSVLSAPCCGQFAVSREGVWRNEKVVYERLLEWVEQTRLDDKIAGRVMEYAWQYLFTGKEELCPEEISCYCGMYGVCFDSRENGRDEYDMWFELREEWRDAENKLREIIKEQGEEALGEDHVKVLVERTRQLRDEVVEQREAAWTNPEVDTDWLRLED